MDTFSKNPFKTVEAQIINGGEGKVLGSREGWGWSLGAGELWIAVFRSRGLDTHRRRRPW